MNWNQYFALFDPIVSGENTEAPYDNPAYVNYVKMNKRRSDRWLKQASISEATIKAVKSIQSPQKWIVISEPWCGDAAHSIPIIALMAEMNENISLEFVLRDSNDLIDSYLTNGGKSIPKLIARNENGEDLFVWGPRPKEIQAEIVKMKDNPIPFEEKNALVQNWYNKDQAEKIQQEIAELIKN